MCSQVCVDKERSVSWLSLVKLHIHGVVNMGSTPVEASSGVSMIDRHIVYRISYIRYFKMAARDNRLLKIIGQDGLIRGIYGNLSNI